MGNLFYTIAYLVLAAAGIIITVLFVRSFKNAAFSEKDYDERQLRDLARGNSLALRVVIAGLIIGVALYALIDAVALPASCYMLALIFVGILVAVIYALWHDAYFGLKDVSAVWGPCYVALGVLFLCFGVLDALEKGLEALLSLAGFWDISFGLGCLLIGFAIIVRRRIVRRRDAQEDAGDAL